MSDNRLWILGADDPEMQAIESLLKEYGDRVVYALDKSGQRVHPGSAYQTCGRSAGHDGLQITHSVECGGSYLDGGSIMVIDHHRPGDEHCSRCGGARDYSEQGHRWNLTVDDAGSPGGQTACGDCHQWIGRAADPGYGKPPEEFLTASSIGQVVAVLGLSVSREITLTAAADHCLAAAYQGRCPGVDPDALMRWRVETRAKHQGRSVDEVLADIERARRVLRDKTRARSHGAYAQPGEIVPDPFSGQPLRSVESYREADPSWDDWGSVGYGVPLFADLRGQSIPELPEAACREGLAYVATVTDRDGRTKDVLGGCTTPEMVREWMDQRRAEGCEVYGDPARGFAGAYRAAAIVV